jgi:3D (Asp-Asp-Asp) domain-containing protein
MRLHLVAMGLIAALVCNPANAQTSTLGACKFDSVSLSFAGDELAQARCLMRPVLVGGQLGADTPLPPTLSQLIGKAPNLAQSRLTEFLNASKSPAIKALSGSLLNPVSRADSNTVNAPSARYFVIHDTSTPNLGSIQSFPLDIDVSDNVNNLDRYPTGDKALAHFFVSRRGEVRLFRDFVIPWRATALELEYVGTRSRGLFLHIELVQPRRNNAAGIDLYAPTPGFTQAQYDHLATLYVVASFRAKKWLIPATHLGVTFPLKGLHDDPQNFEPARFDVAVAALIANLTASLQPTGVTPLPPLRASLYYTALQSDYAAGSEVALLSKEGALLARVSQEFSQKAAIEGSAKLSDGRLLNVDGVIGGTRRWRIVSTEYGLDAIGCPLVPLRSAAVDRLTVPLRTILFLPETVGIRRADGTAHDGIWYAVDTGSAIQKDRIDLFLGAGKATMQAVYTHGISHLRPLSVERRGNLTGCPS